MATNVDDCEIEYNIHFDKFTESEESLIDATHEYNEFTQPHLYELPICNQLELSFGQSNGTQLLISIDTTYRAMLKTYTVPDHVEYIPSFTFTGCVNLTSVTIHQSMNRISPYAFFGCKNLKNIQIKPDGTDNNYVQEYCDKFGIFCQII